MDTDEQDWLQVKWQDFRLNFLNLNPNTDLNTMSPTEYASIWQPAVFFKGQSHEAKSIQALVCEIVRANSFNCNGRNI